MSVLWATCNIGAAKPEKNGWYFQWAGTTPYDKNRIPLGGVDPVEIWFNTNCPYWVSGETTTTTKWSKYTDMTTSSSSGVPDNKITLESIDDAACMHMKDGWRMPTSTEYNELFNACNVAWVENYKGTGVNGTLFTLKSNSSKILFFPASGYVNGSNYGTGTTYYWTSSFYKGDDAAVFGRCMLTKSNDCYMMIDFRCKGNSIRAVKPRPKQYEFVDMGLSVNWATCNIGATKPEEYGWYFMWGDTTPYNSDRTPVGGGSTMSFDWINYPLCSGTSDTITKYNDADKKMILEPKDDAAHAHIGGDWRMPTREEYNELISACDIKWMNNYNNTGVNGRLFILKSDTSKTLFFPAAGYQYLDSTKSFNSTCDYWTSSVSSNGSYSTEFCASSSMAQTLGFHRCCGYSVRGVQSK